MIEYITLSGDKVGVERDAKSIGGEMFTGYRVKIGKSFWGLPDEYFLAEEDVKGIKEKIKETEKKGAL